MCSDSEFDSVSGPRFRLLKFDILRNLSPPDSEFQQINEICLLFKTLLDINYRTDMKEISSKGRLKQVWVIDH